MPEVNMHETRNRYSSSPASLLVKGPPDTAPAWKLRIKYMRKPARDITARLVSASITSDPQGGMAMVFVVTGRMAGYEGYFTTFVAGYGDELERLFRGEITSIMDSPNGTSQVTASGTSVLRGRQRLNMGLDFSNLNLRQAMEYINTHSGEFGDWQVVGGEDWKIHDPRAETPADRFDPAAATQQPGFGVFGSEVTWTEAERTLLDPSPYISYDNPLGHVTHRKPEIRYGGDPVNYMWWWSTHASMDRYDKGGFKFTAGSSQVYDRVIVFRRITDYGEFITESRGAGKPRRVREFYGVYAEVKINRTGLHPARLNSDHYVPDFNGTQAQAEKEAARLAAEYRTVKGTFEYTGPLRTWWPYDVFYVEQIEERPDPRVAYVTGVPLPAGRSSHVRSIYTCLIDGGIQQQVSKATFKATVSGQAALHSMHAVRSLAETSYRSTGLVPTAKDPPSGTIESSSYGQVV